MLLIYVFPTLFKIIILECLLSGCVKSNAHCKTVPCSTAAATYVFVFTVLLGHIVFSCA